MLAILSLPLLIVICKSIYNQPISNRAFTDITVIAILQRIIFTESKIIAFMYIHMTHIKGDPNNLDHLVYINNFFEIQHININHGTSCTHNHTQLRI